MRSTHHISKRFPDWIRFDLFRFRSPLLTESLLFSFPPDTKMFYFSGFPYARMRVSCGLLNRKWMSYSRISGSAAACA